MTYRSVYFMFPMVLVVLSCGCSKAPVIVAVDMERVVSESKQAKRIMDEVESFAKSVQSQLNQAQEQVRAASSDPASDPDQVNYMRAQLSQMARRAEEEVNLKRYQAEDEVQKVLDKNLNILAKKNGWDMVVSKGPHAAIWINDAMDQTSLVIRQMNSYEGSGS